MLDEEEAIGELRRYQQTYQATVALQAIVVPQVATDPVANATRPLSEENCQATPPASIPWNLCDQMITTSDVS